MKCPGSVRLCENTARRSSEYADEGTAAHALAELCLKDAFKNPGLFLEVMADSHLGEIVEGRPVTADMIEAVNVYLTEIYSDTQPGDEQEFEVRFSLNALHTGLFGTADRVRFRPSTQTLRITDYKHGAGVPVEVEANPQLMYYAIGGAMQLKDAGVRTIEIQIVQPRCPHSDGPIRTWSMDVVDLIEFAADLKDAAMRTEAENAPLVPGSHCRWCAAAGFCPAIKTQAIETAAREFDVGLEYDPGELSEALERVPMIKQWLKSVESFAYSEAAAGRIPPGYKIVEKRATRKWRDDIQATKDLISMNIEPDKFQEPAKLKSPAALEKAIGKKLMKDMEEHVVSESSGTALAPLKDRRPAVAKASVQEEFEAWDDESSD